MGPERNPSTLDRGRPDPHRRVRAGDADREEVAARLGEAFAEGRLDVEELQARLDAAYAALTRDELDGLVADLPSVAPTPDPGPPARRRWLCCGL